MVHFQKAKNLRISLQSIFNLHCNTVANIYQLKKVLQESLLPLACHCIPDKCWTLYHNYNQMCNILRRMAFASLKLKWSQWIFWFSAFLPQNKIILFWGGYSSKLILMTWCRCLAILSIKIQLDIYRYSSIIYTVWNTIACITQSSMKKISNIRHHNNNTVTMHLQIQIYTNKIKFCSTLSVSTNPF